MHYNFFHMNPLPHSIQSSTRRIVISLTAAFALCLCGNALAAEADPASEMALQFQRFSKAVLLIDRGHAEGYTQLQDSQQKFNAKLAEMQMAVNSRNCPAPQSASLQARLSGLLEEWGKFDKGAGMLLAYEATMKEIRSAANNINDAEAGMTELTQQLAVMKLVSSAPPREISAANQLVFVQARLVTNVKRIVLDESPSPEVAFMIGKDTNTINDLIQGMLHGSKPLRLSPTKAEDERTKLLEISRKFETVKLTSAIIMRNLSEHVQTKIVTQHVIANEDNLYRYLLQIRNEALAVPACFSDKPN